MRTAMAPPWPVSGYGAVVPKIAPFEETTAIWYTPTNYDDPEDAVEGAAEQAEAFSQAGYVLTGVGMEPVSFDPETKTGVFKGYITFAGDAPSGSQPVMGIVEKPPWWHYGLAAGGGIIGGVIIGAIIGYAAR